MWISSRSSHSLLDLGIPEKNSGNRKVKIFLGQSPYLPFLPWFFTIDLKGVSLFRSMFECVCGRSFKYQSGLSRHQHGNVKQGVKECQKHQDHVKAQKEERKARYLEAQQRERDLERAIQVGDHTPSYIPEYMLENEIIPLMHNKGAPVDKRLEMTGESQVYKALLKMVTNSFRQIYMNLDHPENWNVVLQNISSWDMKVRRNGAWIIESFNDWAEDFITQVTLGYIEKTETPSDVVQVLAIMLRVRDDNRTDIYKALKKEVSNEYMRSVIKEQYNFK